MTQCARACAGGSVLQSGCTTIPGLIDHSGRLWAFLSPVSLTSNSPVESLYTGLCLYDGFAWRQMQEGTPRTGGDCWSMARASPSFHRRGLDWRRLGLQLGGRARIDGIAWTKYTPAEGLGDKYRVRCHDRSIGASVRRSMAEERVSYFVDGSWTVLDLSGVSARRASHARPPALPTPRGTSVSGFGESRASLRRLLLDNRSLLCPGHRTFGISSRLGMGSFSSWERGWGYSAWSEE